eukprot:10000859-Karenia_brevis.AAC.1
MLLPRLTPAQLEREAYDINTTEYFITHGHNRDWEPKYFYKLPRRIGDAMVLSPLPIIIPVWVD